MDDMPSEIIQKAMDAFDIRIGRNEVEIPSRTSRDANRGKWTCARCAERIPRRSGFPVDIMEDNLIIHVGRMRLSYLCRDCYDAASRISRR
jgi:ubiquitin C-terminal hydrolase